MGELAGLPSSTSVMEAGKTGRSMEKAKRREKKGNEV
jgi:hypothetical protein